MTNKAQLLKMLTEEFNRWEALLGRLTEAQVTAPLPNSDRSLKDDVAHLHAWQQRSIARLEAVLTGREPSYPAWPEGLDPEADDVGHLNAWIYATNRDQPWPSVYREWREGFLNFLELAAAIAEADLFDKGKYPWLQGYCPADVVTGSYEHHHIDHLEPLLAWQDSHGSAAKGPPAP